MADADVQVQQPAIPEMNVFLEADR